MRTLSVFCAELSGEKHSNCDGGLPSDRGFILVAVLAALAVLSALAASFAIATRLQTRVAANTALVTRLEAAAEAGISHAVLNLLGHADPAAHPHQACALDDDITINTSVEDEAGKVDLNYGDERLLAPLLLYAGIPEVEVAAHIDRIVDFRDKDELKRPHGAETAEYRAAGLGYGPKNSEFATVEELEQVLLLPEAVVSAIRPFVTVHSKQLGIDPDVASTALLDALNGTAGPQNGNLETTYRAQQLMLGRYPFPQELRARSNRTTFTITSVAWTRTGGQFARRAVIELNSQLGIPYRVLDWQRVRGSAVVPREATVLCR